MRRLALHGGRIQTAHIPPPPFKFKSRLALLDRFEPKFIKILHQETRDTVWSLVDKLRQAKRRLPLVRAALDHGLSTDELSSFNRAVFANGLDAALSYLRYKGFATTEIKPDNGLKLLPTWLILFLVTQKVQTRGQTGPMVDMVVSYLPVIPLNVKPSLLVMATLALARFDVLSSLGSIVHLFLTTPLPHPALQFNLLLRAISRFTSSVEAANQVVSILAAMESRQIPLQSRTYDALLSNRFVTVQLVKTLRARMLHDGFVPTVAHLEAYLRIFAKNGAIHDARQYHDAIRLLAANKQRPRRINSNSTEPSTRTADTLFLGAFRDDRASAFRYLSNLLKVEREKISLPSDRRLLHSHDPRFRSPSSKKCVDIRDWTTALAVAARDKTTSSKSLVNIFQSALVRTTSFRPTIATYTVVIQGLLYRRDYVEAEQFWNRLLQESFVLDRKALTVGLQVLTRVGKPHAAFEILEYFAAKPDTRSTTPFETPPSCPPGRAIAMNAIAINEFMVSLLRIGRPDVVFKFWDHSETLYGVSPDAISLNILLKSARLSAKLDDSFAGAFAQLVFRSPFRKHRKRTDKPSSRQNIVHTIQNMLVDENGRPKDYATVMWNDVPAWQWVVTIFHQVVLGNWPHLSSVRPPASATRISDNGSPLHFLRNFVNKRKDRPQYSRIASRAPYSQIYLTDDTFFAYIQLLGVQSLSTEIPLALAWMCALKIEPSTDTLALALVFWAEVSLHGPLIETLVGERSEYVKLVRWIRDWVGHDKAPGDEDIRRWLKIVAKMRTNC